MSTASPEAAPRAVGVVGLGLIGASLCGALRRHVPGVRIAGVARRAEVASGALADGLCDVAGSEASVLEGSEVVVLCTPVDVMPEWMAAIDAAAPGALVTDAGSTKAWVCERGRELLPGRFCGGHPMAGRERSGYGAADPDLFRGATWVLTPPEPVEATLLRFAPWRRAVEAIGARVEVMDSRAHDAAVALVSHMPFAVSCALMRAAAADPAWEWGRRLAATGFRDMVRISGGDPAMYAAIATTNREQILDAVDRLIEELDSLVEVFDDAERLRDWFAVARQERAGWLEEREREGSPLP